MVSSTLCPAVHILGFSSVYLLLFLLLLNLPLLCFFFLLHLLLLEGSTIQQPVS